MTTAEHTFASNSLGSVLTGQASAWRFNRRVLLATAFVGFMFFVSDHGWLISRYEDYAGTSEYMQTVTTEGNIGRQASIFALGLAGAIVLARSTGYRFRLASPLSILIIATASWCVASLLWSIEPGIAARRLVATGCVAICALAAVRILKPVELAAGSLLCCAGYLIIGFLTEIALGTFRPWLASHRFAGTLHPNLQGLNCALLVMAAAYLGWHTVRYRQAMWALAVLGLFGIWLAKSRTPLIALVVAETIFWLATTSWRSRIVAVLAAIFAASCFMLIASDQQLERISQASFLSRADDDETDVTNLTGRVALWEKLSESVTEHPWRGFGFNSFWTPQNIEDVSDSQQWAISVAHSAYLDLTLSIGMIGCGLALAVVLWSLLRAVRLHIAMPTVGFGFVAVLLLFVLVHGITESAFANTGFMPLVVLAGMAMVAFVDPAQYANHDVLEAAQNT